MGLPIKIYQLLIPSHAREIIRNSKNAIKNQAKKLGAITINLLYSPLALGLKGFGFIFPDFQYLNRIGHLASEPDMFLKEAYLDGRHYSHPVLLIKNNIANASLAAYWEKYYLVIKNKSLVRVLEPLLRHPLTGYETKKYVVAMNQTAQAFTIQSRWGGQDPLLRIYSHHEKEGRLILRDLGLEPDRWHVCIHARTPHYSPGDEHYNNFRNFDFEDFLLAINWIHNHGGISIRMGDSGMNPINKIPGLIDYATSNLKKDWLDIYLAGSCRFFLGSASGLYNVASVFGKPVAAVNMAPLSMVLPLAKGDIGIPKLYRDRESARLLGFDEIISMGAANYRFSDEFTEAGIQLESNSPEDILDLVIEQYNRTEGVFFASEEDLHLQNLFTALFKNGDYCYGSSANIGSAFLRKYKDLLK